jgi:predicted transcriptional regulator
MKKEVKPKKKAPTPVRVPDDLKAKLQKLAEKENRSLSNLIITILKDYVK